MKKFDLYNYFYGLNEAEQTLPVQDQMTPDQVAQVQSQPKQNQPNGSEVFRKLQGQIIAGVEYSPSGANGGAIKIKIKNSYQPFTISWVNGQVTVTDMSGKTIMLSDTSPQ